MILDKYLKLSFLLSMLIIASCGENKEDVVYVKQWDGKYIAKVATSSAGLNSLAVEVSVGTIEQKENDDLILVYEARGHNAQVLWKGKETLIIVNCQSTIDYVKSQYYFEYEMDTIYVQPVISGNIEVDGKSYCKS